MILGYRAFVPKFGKLDRFNEWGLRTPVSYRLTQ